MKKYTIKPLKWEVKTNTEEYIEFISSKTIFGTIYSITNKRWDEVERLHFPVGYLHAICNNDEECYWEDDKIVKTIEEGIEWCNNHYKKYLEKSVLDVVKTKVFVAKLDSPNSYTTHLEWPDEYFMSVATNVYDLEDFETVVDKFDWWTYCIRIIEIIDKK